MKRQNSITPDDITNFLAEGALWRNNQRIHLFWGGFKSSVDLNNEEISITYANFFECKPEAARVYSKHIELSQSEFTSILTSFVEKQRSLGVFCELTEVPWEEASFESFQQSFQTIQTAIEKGTITKAVPIVFEKSKQVFNSALKAQALICATQAPENLHVYGEWNQSAGSLGVSPEILFRMKQNELETMALAGTLPKANLPANGAGAELLLHDNKERHEHQLVIEDIAQVLNNFGKVEVQETTVLELPHLYHLYTPIKVLLNKQYAVDRFVQALHPTPALGVAPRSVGANWMLQLPEQNERACFGAPFVVGRLDEAVAIVAIRQIQWDEWGIRIGSGCGVVMGSQLDREWKELVQKRSSVKKLLGFMK